MAVTIDGTTGITTPGITNTGTDTLVDLTTGQCGRLTIASGASGLLTASAEL